MEREEGSSGTSEGPCLVGLVPSEEETKVKIACMVDVSFTVLGNDGRACTCIHRDESKTIRPMVIKRIITSQEEEAAEKEKKRKTISTKIKIKL